MQLLFLCVALTAAAFEVTASASAIQLHSRSAPPAFDGIITPLGCKEDAAPRISYVWFMCQGAEEEVVPPNCRVSRRFTPATEVWKRFEVECDNPEGPSFRFRRLRVFNGTAPADCAPARNKYPGNNAHKVFFKCDGAVADDVIANVPRTCDVQERLRSGAVVIKCPDHGRTVSDAEVAAMPFRLPRRRKLAKQERACSDAIADPGNPNIEYSKCMGNPDAIPFACDVILTDTQEWFYSKCPVEELF